MRIPSELENMHIVRIPEAEESSGGEMAWSARSNCWPMLRSRSSAIAGDSTPVVYAAESRVHLEPQFTLQRARPAKFPAKAACSREKVTSLQLKRQAAEVGVRQTFR